MGLPFWDSPYIIQMVIEFQGMLVYFPKAACAAAKRATGTRKGEQLT